MMARRALVAMLVLAALCLPAGASAGGGARGMRGAPPGLTIHGKVSNGQANAGAVAVGAGALMFGAGASGDSGEAWRDDPALLVVDAFPPDAHVYLDGRPLGVAGELIARALPVAFGPHVVHVVAPGFRPWAERFVADGSFPTRIRATLTRE
jgi:PEGA domain